MGVGCPVVASVPRMDVTLVLSNRYVSVLLSRHGSGGGGSPRRYKRKACEFRQSSERALHYWLSNHRGKSWLEKAVFLLTQ